MSSHDGLKVLYVDDDSLVLESLSALMASNPSVAQVFSAENGEQALFILDNHAVDVALLDVEMPGMNGLTLCRTIRTRFPQVKVVMLTAFPYPDFLQSALASGARGFLTKDIRVKEIVNQLDYVMQVGQVVSPEPAQHLVDSYRRTAKAREKFSAFLQAVQQLDKRYLPLIPLLAQGLSNQAIAGYLSLSEKTVRHYVSEILDVTQCHSRTEFAYRALESRVVDFPYDE